MRITNAIVFAATVLAGSDHYFKHYFDEVSTDLAKRDATVEDYGNVINYIDFTEDDVDRVPLADDWYQLILDNGPENAEILNDYEREHGIEAAVKHFSQPGWQTAIAKRGWAVGTGDRRVCCSEINLAPQMDCIYLIGGIKNDNTNYCNIAFYYGSAIVRSGTAGCLGGQWIVRNARKVLSMCYTGMGISGYAFPQDSGDKKICLSTNNGCSSSLACI